MKRAVIVICDGLRADMVTPAWAPNLCRLADQGRFFRNHRSVYPSTTRTASASIATGCLPGRHGLEGNCVAIDEGDGLVALSAGPPDFRDRLRRATGQTLRVPTLAERLVNHGGAVIYSNVSPGAALFQDPDDFAELRHRTLAHAPGGTAAAPLATTHDAAGDTEMTTRFIRDVVQGARPALALLWLCEPDHTQHASPLGSPEHLAVLAAADANVARVADAIGDDDDALLLVGSDHGHETIGEVVDLEAMLIEAGLKASSKSQDVVVASNVFGASLYLSDDARDRIPAIIGLLTADDRIAQVFHGAGLAEVGHRPDGPLAIAMTGRQEPTPSAFGIAGTAVAFASPFSSEIKPGCAQHGGLGENEQSPFLIARGAGFAAGSQSHAPTSILDIAPTVLRHLGVAANGMDGQPLE